MELAPGNPCDEFPHFRVPRQGFECIQVPAQFLFGESVVNELMAITAELDAAGRHLHTAEILPEPFVAVQGSGNEMMK